MFRRACRDIARDTGISVGYVEAHGTGTLVGDPIEARGGRRRGPPPRPVGWHPCRIGSMKTNVGHLEGGAGVLGLIKAVLALHHPDHPPDCRPAASHACGRLAAKRPERPHRDRDVDSRPFFFFFFHGYGGTIAHVILEEAPQNPAVSDATRGGSTDTSIVPLSARSGSRLARQACALADHLTMKPSPVADVAATMWRRRPHEAVRAAVVVTAPHELTAGSAGSRPRRSRRRPSPRAPPHRADRQRRSVGVSRATARTGPGWAGS